MAPLLSMIVQTFRDVGHVDIIDVGGTRLYWDIAPVGFLENHKVNITVVNLPGDKPPADDETFSFVEADGCDLSRFGDKSFHIAHSNSVIEHVGDWSRQRRFAAEISRVAEKYFVQTPNYWFALEPHCMMPFFQWLPKPVRVRLVMAFSLGSWPKAASVDEAVTIVESARLLNRSMVRALFNEAKVYTEWFMLLPKSFIAVKR